MMTYVLAATEQEAKAYAKENTIGGWTYVSAPNDLKGINDATVIVLKKWARRRCILTEMMLKTQLSLTNRNTTNTVIYE